MKIINVSADINSQKHNALMGMVPVEQNIKTEAYDTTRVEAQETEEKMPENKKKTRKAKGVSVKNI